MNHYSLIWLILLIIQQFIMFPNWDDSYELPKMLIHSVGLTIFLTILTFRARKLVDLSQTDSRLRIVWLLLCFLPSLVDGLHRNEWFIHSLGLGSLMYCLPYFVVRYPLDWKFVSRIILGLFLAVGFLDYLGLLPWYQGHNYHLSGMVGNPNLLAAMVLFWYFLAFGGEQSSVSKIVAILVLAMLCLTLCRTAILTFFIIHLFLLSVRSWKTRSFKIVGGIGLVGLLLAYGVINPHRISMFSPVSIRIHEALTAIAILKKNLWLGIGQGQFSRHYLEELEQVGLDRGDPFADSSGESLSIRWSTSIHQSSLLVLVWMGLPMGLLWLFCFGFLLMQCRIYLKKNANLLGATLVILIMSQLHFLLDFSLALLPFQLLLAQLYAFTLISKRNGSTTHRRWIPLIVLMIWAAFWLSKLDLHQLRQAAVTVIDLEKLLSHPSSDGEDKHRLIQLKLADSNWKDFEVMHRLLDAAHQQKVDPSTRYHRAMIYLREGKRSDALLEIDKGIRALPAYADYYYARSLMSSRLEDEAADLLLCVRLNGRHYSALKNLAIITLDGGNLELAKFYFQQATKVLRFKIGKWSENKLYAESQGIQQALKYIDSQQKK